MRSSSEPASREPKDNPHLAASLKMVEEKITELFQRRADLEDEIKNAHKTIDGINGQIEVAEEAKKYLQRAIIDSNEAAKYLRIPE